jgi:hypothetical protein
MTINIRKASNVKAVGHHTNGNSKPVFCITDGSVYASVSDAAEKVGVHHSVMSNAISGRSKTCKGKRYCFISDVIVHLDEIATNIYARNQKVEAYDAMIAEQNAAKEAEAKLAIHRANCDKLRAKLEKEMQMMQEAEAVINNRPKSIWAGV